MTQRIRVPPRRVAGLREGRGGLGGGNGSGESEYSIWAPIHSYLHAHPATSTGEFDLPMYTGVLRTGKL